MPPPLISDSALGRFRPESTIGHLTNDPCVIPPNAAAKSLSAKTK
jgi:hypothetical protein